ncbi:TylF/MycF/NovP-related O-methyltransferase [Paraburkholderia sp. BCC1876]|uniref:TylF/MycF/NovP-related O-methyltransferase n=1 Tax=Paraburkholderia sp. BCC1876 TaxID=2676303 RepID=UPI001ABA2665|nr:TylF/MycF/NovP-related O-methyltransferase [Paraburkholderia sp. BCC1876]
MESTLSNFPGLPRVSWLDAEPMPLVPLADQDGAYPYLAMIRRYIGGAADTKAHTDVHTDTPAPAATPDTPATPDALITAADCRERLAEADRIFADWLGPLHRTAAEVAGVDPSRMADALNHMHHASRRLTMCDSVLLDNVVELARVTIDEQVPGDFIETGVWRGGVTILLRAALNAFGDRGRSVWVADSFAGLPTPDPAVDLREAIWHHLMGAVGGLRSDLASVRESFARAGLLDRRVRFLPGWFADTLPAAPIERLALMRLDGDWYESTRVALDALYSRLSPGGFVIVDDYGLPTGCARAVDEYRAAHGIDAPLTRVNGQAVYWRKPW